ncbi:ABC transporter ATP-binding protein [Saccharothrix australiensis]|uniref:Putative ABC transport system ATP-binding protein n=1 Tax=Saccharothrix australiensis TaxID=2072 RepID=A0A495VZD9_9PSEU|nr:ABC transporter ATP-binding protein [Saccharothrix australiensis]RKT53745.1 putative ABC transport system ATP-binding protein [Saccharothrix australiensis]
MSPILTARGLVKRYGDVRALDGVDVDVERGEVVAVVGPSGSGKTSLLRVLSGVLPADGGEVRVDGAAVGDRSEAERAVLRRTVFGLVFQSGMLVAELTAEENAALPALLGGVRWAEALGAAREWLDVLGLAGLASRRPAELSGGQAQRVAIARALVHRPAVVFADEPTAALDSRTGHEVVTSLLTAARAADAAVVLVTHDHGVAGRAHRVLDFRDGRVVAEVTP